jgi:two-component sensor histidine kinase
VGQREALDREVHHRVKNNLQVVSSLLNLQAARIADGPVRHEFMRGKYRIDNMALVHRCLYDQQDLLTVDLQTFFGQLVRALRDRHTPASDRVSVAMDCGGVPADPDTAIELGLIVCELVANCFEHAFPYATGGHVELTVRPLEGPLHRMTVQDNGLGMNQSQAQRAAHMGLEVVEALAQQLEGTFTLRSELGVRCDVVFRMGK